MSRTIDAFFYRTVSTSSPGSIRPYSMFVEGERTIWLRIKRVGMWRWQAVFRVEGKDVLGYSLIYLKFRSCPIRIYGYCDWIIAIFPVWAQHHSHTTSLNVLEIAWHFLQELCLDTRLFPPKFRVSGMFSPYSPFFNFFSFNLEISVYFGLLFSFPRYKWYFLVCFCWLLFAEYAFCRTSNVWSALFYKTIQRYFSVLFILKSHTTLLWKECRLCVPRWL
jgi:hypothetical protein